METTPEIDALLAELLERSSIVAELDGPQIEAWVSGLFPVFDNTVTAAMFIDHCSADRSVVGALVCAAIAELTTGLDDATSAHATAAIGVELPAVAAQIGASVLSAAWTVVAPFGRSIVLGFDNTAEAESVVVDDAIDDETLDLRHSILIEVSDDGVLEDVQLTGAPTVLLAEAAASDHRVAVEPIETVDALRQITAAWPVMASADQQFGAGVAANQQFARRRMFAAHGVALFALDADTDSGDAGVGDADVRRGLSDHEFAEANRAARSTLQAALGVSPDDRTAAESDRVVATWTDVIRGGGGDLSRRERDALLWLEWADWLGAGIGLRRAGVGSPVDGATLVDLVNRCPEVSSSIDKADRDYAEWAFAIAIELLDDVGAVKDGTLTMSGHQAVVPAMFQAWR